MRHISLAIASLAIRGTGLTAHPGHEERGELVYLGARRHASNVAGFGATPGYCGPRKGAPIRVVPGGGHITY